MSIMQKLGNCKAVRVAAAISISPTVSVPLVAIVSDMLTPPALYAEKKDNVTIDKRIDTSDVKLIEEVDDGTDDITIEDDKPLTVYGNYGSKTVFKNRRQHHEVTAAGVLWLAAIGFTGAWYIQKGRYEDNLGWHDNTTIANFDELTDQQSSVKTMGLTSLLLGGAALGWSTYLLKKYNVGPFGGDKDKKSMLEFEYQCADGKTRQIQAKVRF